MFDLETVRNKKRLTDADRYKLASVLADAEELSTIGEADDLSDAELIAKVDAFYKRGTTADMPLRLDIGCGKNKREGFVGIDQYAMPGVDAVCDLSKVRWNFGKLMMVGSQSTVQSGRDVDGMSLVEWILPDNSVDEVHCSHFIEHLTAIERMRFMNELYRVMKPGAKAMLIAPHWCSNRAYGDLTHQWPPVAEMWFYYLRKPWRDEQAPHTDAKYNPDGYTCDFEATWSYTLHPAILPRTAEFQQEAIQYKKEAAQDIIATLTKL